MSVNTTFNQLHNMVSFRKQHSTQHGIIDIVDKIYKNLSNNEFTFAIFIDLNKAFDTVDHNILLIKLYHGIRGLMYDWFASYLSSRFQTSAISSIEEKRSCCVPQGSVLGPLLFLLHINYICVSSSKFNFYLFANDTSIIYSQKNIRVLEQVVNS